MSYQVLALKYRPQTFQEVIGQAHVTVTLSNAVSNGKVAHALMFSGPRGTGKTTTARIFAKAMNCVHGPVSTPCNRCVLCREITAGNASDVFEIDGASNNSVDQIRELKENVAYMPASARFKIYIIDEVHMLSTAAFNALLKTLEEPPRHILFVFATTEPHKIPATILSRCQRHDLGRIPAKMIADNLMTLCRKEGYDISEKTALIISQQADGSVRDSLSLLDRLFSASDKKEISHAFALKTLGITDKALLSEISHAILKSDGAAVIEIVEKINDLGLDFKQFYYDTVEHVRNLAVLKICGPSASSLDIPEDEVPAAQQCVSGASGVYLGRLLHLLLEEERIIKFCSHTKTALETVFLTMCQVKGSVEIDEIISKLDLVAERIDRLKAGEDETEGRSPRTPASERDDHVPQQKEKEKELTESQADPSDEKKVEDEENGVTESKKTWEHLLEKLAKTFPMLYNILAKGALKKITSDCIIINLDACTSYEISRVASKKDAIENICKDCFKKSIKLEIEQGNTLKQKKGDSNNPNSRADDKETPAKTKQAALNHPFVADTVRIFNGSVVDII